MKKILGLDLGSTSVGWAIVNSADKKEEHSEILGCGSRVVPLTVDEKDSFEKGKAITTNSDRTLKRSMRRNLQRRKQRRDNLKQLLMAEGWISAGTRLSEDGKGTTYETMRLRALSATDEISLPELARVMLSINKKRGYKSSRKTDSSEEGQLIDGMQVAKELAQSGWTPSQYALKAIEDGKSGKIDFYRSDLEKEYDRIWASQQPFHPTILTEDFKKQISRQGKSGTSSIFLGRYGIYTADNKGKDRKLTALRWRISALNNKLEEDKLAYVLADLRGEIQNSSGYLGEISDRSKELFFRDETVGQYLYRNIIETPEYSTRNKVFYRQDYIDEFNKIWSVQSQFHPELTDKLKKTLSDNILFFQRSLKSHKGLISFCEFESHPIAVMVEGKKKVKITGSRVAPRSSLLFQEFKVLQGLNNVSVYDMSQDESRLLHQEERDLLFKELSAAANMKQSDALKLLGLSPRRYKLNFKELEGNSTLSSFFDKYLDIVDLSGHGEYVSSKLRYDEKIHIVKDVFTLLGCNADIFSFRSELPKEEYEQQPIFKLWHLLYSYEGDGSKTGNESLIVKIQEITGLEKDYAKVLSAIKFKDDYASLSHKAIIKLLPFLKQGYQYDMACSLAGYNHSHYETSENLGNKVLVNQLSPLPKGSLRNPVVEKIINQMINVVNAVTKDYGKPDEIHIELARGLKKSSKEREKASKEIDSNKRRNEDIEQLLKQEFNLSYVRQSDILRYRLYDELKANGYKTLYSCKYIPASALFSKDIDIEHIIPQALMFDDSFANKTLEYKDTNIEKGRKTANDYVKYKYGEDFYSRYRLNIDDLCNRGAIGEKKRKYLLMKEEEIPSGFIDRDLRNSQYIARKAQEILSNFVRTILPTTGSVTAELREQWQLVDVMKEINFEKYDKAGKTHFDTTSDGKLIKRIDDDWSKRNDHRHHAMDAITIAFTKREHINILNNLNARSRNDAAFDAMFSKNTIRSGSGWLFTPPMPLDELRREFKKHLESTLVSIKAKNKVVTRNVNKTKTTSGVKHKTELTPRGALHKEQVYGKRRLYEVFEAPVNSKMDEDAISFVASPAIRQALYIRLEQNGGDPKKAFSGKNSLDNVPLYIDENHTRCVPAKVKCVKLVDVFTIRKEIGPDLRLDKVMDCRIRRRIQERIDEFGGNVKAALSNLDNNPIYLDDARTIPIKRVTIKENLNGHAIRRKIDKEGNLILDETGAPIINDYVELKNNHHVALYVDGDGKIHEDVVSMYEALNRVNQGVPIINKNYKSDQGWSFLFTIKNNEMFVFPDDTKGFNPKDINLIDPNNYSLISPNLFRVQSISTSDYVFRHHLETSTSRDSRLKDITWKRITDIKKMVAAVKVRIDHIGRIVAVGEYD